MTERVYKHKNRRRLVCCGKTWKPDPISTLRRFIGIQTDSSSDFSLWSRTKTPSRWRFVCWFSVRHYLFGLRCFWKRIKPYVRLVCKLGGLIGGRHTPGSLAGASSLFHGWQPSSSRYHIRARSHEHAASTKGRKPELITHRQAFGVNISVPPHHWETLLTYLTKIFSVWFGVGT